MPFLSMDDVRKMPKWILAVSAAGAVLIVAYQMFRGEALVCANGAIFAKTCDKPVIVSEAPVGAVVSFDLESCPEMMGWEEYPKAYGVFVRGIDRGDKKRDPDGERVRGSFQKESFGTHYHAFFGTSSAGTTSADRGSDRQGLWHGGDPEQKNRRDTSPSGEQETRPANIALLYCVKKRLVD